METGEYKKMNDVKEILKDIRKVRDSLVAQANPHFQALTNIIYKWETKIAMRNALEKDIIDLEAGGIKLNQRYKRKLIKRVEEKTNEKK